MGKISRNVRICPDTTGEMEKHPTHTIQHNVAYKGSVGMMWLLNPSPIAPPADQSALEALDSEGSERAK